MAEVKFIFEGITTKIQCTKNEIIRDICIKFSNKIQKNINKLYFLFGGNILNLDLKLEQIINNENEITILAYEKDESFLKYSNCGTNINNKINNDIILSNNDIIETLIGIKSQLENIINSNNSINIMKSQIKNINLILDNSIKEIKKNNNKLQISNNNEIKNQIKIIEGIINIEENDISKDIIIYNSRENIDTYINNVKINLNKGKNNQRICKFKNEGQYQFKLIFNNNITDLYEFFGDCSQISFIDLSNFDSSNITNVYRMFNNCNKLKEIKGLNNFNTKNIIIMTAMFQYCNELEYLDLSNFDTSKVVAMGAMFNKCNKLKEIKGINKFNTSNVINMTTMFQECNELIFLDLSNFDTTKVTDMSYMFVSGQN